MTEEIIAPRKYIKLNELIYNHIKFLIPSQKIPEIAAQTRVSKARIYEIASALNENPSLTWTEFYNHKGRKCEDHTEIKQKIVEIFTRDASLTQKGVKQILLDEHGINISLPTICRLTAEAGFTRKRVKKKSSILLDESHMQTVVNFCSRLTVLRNKNIIFLDESGFNLHTSNSYGYSLVNTDAIRYVTSSRGRNISLCAAFSTAGLIHTEITEGGYNTEKFLSFIQDLMQHIISPRETIIVLDNVRFHHERRIKQFFESQYVQVEYLPTYSPEFNPIENVFSSLKSFVGTYRPIPRNKNQLMDIIQQAIVNFNTKEPSEFLNFYRCFWERINLRLSQ